MDFAQLKKKAFELKDKTVDFTKKTIEETAVKVSESKIVLKTQEELVDFISKSENKHFITPEWVEKNFVKRTYLVVGDGKKEFFKEFLLYLPVFLTKAFSQNVVFKMADCNNTALLLEEYNIWEFPALLVFENKQLYKMILWEDNVKKVVKTLDLDINNTIDQL